jgi:hypothetical protein
MLARPGLLLPPIYHPSRHSAGQPIVAGWCYLWIAGLSASPDSWTAPLYAHRLAVGDNTNTIAAARVRALLARLEPGPLTPLFAFDAGFDPVQLSVGLSDVDVQIVVCIRDDRKSSPRRHRAGPDRVDGVDVPAATATGSPAPTRAPGRHPTRCTAVTTTSTGTWTCKPGTGYTPTSAPTAIPAAR